LHIRYTKIVGTRGWYEYLATADEELKRLFVERANELQIVLPHNIDEIGMGLGHPQTFLREPFRIKAIDTIRK
jgi:hypothetical protein